MGRGKGLRRLVGEALYAAAVAHQAEADRLDGQAKARKKRRAKCTCKAYPWPHRPGGGFCRWPKQPLKTWKGQPGKNSPVGMRRRSAIRRRLLKHYHLHPIRDRDRIRRWLPKLYVAYCRRKGYPYADWWFGKYVPAMRVTAEGPKVSVSPAHQGKRIGSK